jgi:hypothetical protein
VVAVRHRRVAAIAAMIAVVLALAGCGYSLAGRGSFLPSYIRTIGIPPLVNNTSVFEIEEPLTQRVRAEFISRGRYKVIPETTGADAVLTGEITNVSVTPTSFNEERQASRYNITIRARMEFRDVKSDKLLWNDQNMQFTEEYEVATAGEAIPDAAAFFGQESNALERLSTNFARALASAIMESF